MTSSGPIVSVCVPVYNTQRFVGAAIESVLAQTFRDFEIVIVDNASTDRTPEVLAALSDPRIRLYRNDRNIGAAANFNRAMSLARGRYLKVLCADDVLYPACLERQVAVFESDPAGAVAVVCCARDIIDDRHRRWLRRGWRGAPRRVPGAAAVRATVRSGTNVFGEPAAILVRTEQARAVGGFDARYGFCLDLDLWCRLLRNGALHVLTETLCGFRLSNQSWSAAIGTRQRGEFVAFVEDLRARGVTVSPLDLACARTRAGLNAVLRQGVSRMLLWSSQPS